MSKQGTVKIFKIKSKEFPDKQWDSINHMIYTTESRKVIKEDKEYRRKINFDFWQTAQEGGGYFTRSYLTKDKTAVIKIEVCCDETHNYLNDHYYQPHIDEGCWTIEELLSPIMDIQLNKDQVQIVCNLLENACRGYDDWKLSQQNN